MKKQKIAKLADQQTHTLSLKERRAIGKQARQKAPRESHAEWSLPSARIG